MASLGKKFDATEHDSDNFGKGSYEELPAGIFQFEIEATDVVDTGPEDNRTGKGMKYTAVVLAPDEYKDRKFFGFINLENKNADAQRIGQEEFSALCRALGLQEVEDSEELHFIAYTAELGMGKPSKKKNPDGTPMYPARIEVKKYFYPDLGNVPEPAVSDEQPTAQVKPANDNKPAPAAAAKPAGARPWGKAK